MQMGSRENSAHHLSPRPGGRREANQGAGRTSSRGAVGNADASYPAACTTLDMFLSSLPPGSAAAPALASPPAVRAPAPAPSPERGPRSPAPSSTSGGRKRARGRQQQPSRSRRRRSGSEEWTPPKGDDAVSGPPAAAPALSGPKDSVDGAATATGGQFQKGCGNPVVQVRLPSGACDVWLLLASR